MQIMRVAFVPRKSTTGTALQLGKCTIRTTCKSQAVTALSSGEAEYYGLVSGLCQALGEQSALQDWGNKVSIVGYMDATTGLSIGSRHGLGKVKHIDTVFLVHRARFCLERRSCSRSTLMICLQIFSPNLWKPNACENYSRI